MESLDVDAMCHLEAVMFFSSLTDIRRAIKEHNDLKMTHCAFVDGC